MLGRRLTSLIFVAAVCCGRLLAQDAPAQEPSGLKVELRSATGSNRFQLGEVIPLEVLISSSAPNRYLEPCQMFWESCFGYPQCRYFTRWSFDVDPGTGWTDIGFHGCGAMSGPTFEIKSSDLTSEPKKYTYTLTNRYRFDQPGKYTVRLSLKFGLDDETNAIGNKGTPEEKHHSVSKTAEMTLEIVTAGDEWKKATVEQGTAAFIAPELPCTNPPSPEFLKQQQQREALCNLGTPEAAIALAGLLGRGIDVAHCLRNNANKDVEAAEMGRLLVDPGVGVRPMFFAYYAKLLSPAAAKPGEYAAVPPDVVNKVRDTLFRSLSKKSPEALAPSLETVLRNPMNGYWVVPGSVYDLHDPYSPDVIAMVAEAFEDLTEEAQSALLDREWEHIRSPLMLPEVRRKAQAGDGHALLCWRDLDPVSATEFIRQEIVKPEPRFSSLYLRLPDESLSNQEQQIAANFVTLSNNEELLRSATLLHRYATETVLPSVLPFIDQHLAEWPCGVQIPVLAYLLKVSPEDAKPRVEQVLQKVRPPYCPRGEFFPSLGHVEANAVLDELAARQLKDGTPLAADATEYLRRYGSAAMKPVVREQLSIWHKKFVESGAELRMKNPITSQKSAQDDWGLYNLDSKLLDAYVKAHGWILSPDDVRDLAKLIGDEEAKQLACSFSCSSSVSVGPGPGSYYIYGRVHDPIYPPEQRIDYLMPTDTYQYSVDQYQCDNLESLKQKLLQFPVGSTFGFANTGSGRDAGDWSQISAFLRSHGYQARD